MNDLISREQAIDTVDKYFKMIELNGDICIDGLISLPSAQPEPCDDPRADVYYLAEKIGIHRLYALVVELRGEPEPCEDAVSRKDVVKFLDDWMSALNANCHHQSMADLKIIKNDFENLPSAQPEQRWIPCSERLPEEYGNYLITTHDGNVDIGTIDPKKKGVWSACDADGFYWLREVNAWMPLPEPYREEGGE